MKKILSVSSAVVLIGYLFATGDAAQAAKPAEVQVVKGKIEEISVGTGSLGANMSEITIIDGSGQKLNFAVNTGLGIILSGGSKSVSLRQIKKGEMAAVSYIITKNDIKKAIAIEVFRYKQ